MQLKRWITAIIALPLLIALVYKGHPVLFSLLASLVSLLGMWEYFRIVCRRPEGGVKRILPLYGLGIATGWAIIWAAYIEAMGLIIGILAVNLILSSLIAFFNVGSDPKISDTLTKQITGTLYVPLLLSFLVLIRNGTQGVEWIIFLMAVVCSGDTFAYYGGTYLGRHKLCRLVSPGKTVEGSVAGLLANVCAGYALRYLMVLPVSAGMCLMLSLSLGIAGQIGDLFESLLKRAADIKDSGGLLPGRC